MPYSSSVAAPPPISHYKILFRFKALLWESSTRVSPHPTCKAYPIAILLYDHWAIHALLPTALLYPVNHTILVMAISCKGQSAKLNHFFRITPPLLTTKADDIADAHLAAAVAAITHTPAAFYQSGHPPALRARLHAPVTASSHTASDGGGAGFASLRTIAPGAYLVSFIDTLPHLVSHPREI